MTFLATLVKCLSPPLRFPLVDSLSKHRGTLRQICSHVDGHTGELRQYNSAHPHDECATQVSLLWAPQVSQQRVQSLADLPGRARVLQSKQCGSEVRKCCQFAVGVRTLI